MNQTSQDQQQAYHPMVVMQPGERVVCEVKRHPIGILMTYIGAFVAVAIAAILFYFLVPYIADQSGSSTEEMMPMLLTGAGILLVGLVVILLIATIVYWQNQWIVTTDSITQINQSGLFGRQVSQVSMENLEDVTVDQTGILPHMLNYGSLKVESAGERSKFVFLYCPRPNDYARQILDTHEKFLEERRNIQYINRNDTASAASNS